ncbi:MAG TPA: uroporphyrinogen decarboxylase family protein [Candidatus Limnocylindrales bacterium]|nr:uroporphyrinogen decarboxylase family protein [Candidatus Limnocylindrales bacterium]
MNSRERALLSLAHKEPDRVPFDLGGTVLTSISIHSYKKLVEYLGLPEREIRVMDIFQQIAEIDDDVRAKLECDIRNVAPRSSATFRIDINQTEMPGYDFFFDEWGIGWRMPKEGGFFYDMYHHPLSEATSIDDLKKHNWPNPTDPGRFTGLRERARHVAEDLGELVVAGGMAAGMFEITSWLRGYGNIYPDLVNNLPLVEYLMDKIVDIKLAYWEIALPELAGYVDVVQEADDLAGQFGLLISPETYRKLIKPRHKRIVDFVKARTDARVFYHCCGAIREIIPDLIECGFDIINPVQVSATGMESKALKRDFGSEIVFWGGTVDTQGVFTDGTPAQVRDEVRRRVDDFAPSGGFIAAAVHNIQANVPPENIVAMVDAVRKYGDYLPDNAPGRRPEDYWEGYPEPVVIQASTNHSPDSRIAGRALTPEEAAALVQKSTNLPPVLVKLRDGIIDGSIGQALTAVNEALAEGITPLQIIDDVVIPSMEVVGEKFECGDYFLPEMMASALSTQGIMKVLRPKLAETGVKPLAKVIIGTVKGDLHDIGKNLVAMMWEGGGFAVTDLGPNVPPERFVEVIRADEDVRLVGLSALLTTTMPMMSKIVKAIEDAGLRGQVKIMVGGPSVSQAFVDEIGADGYAPDASSAVRRAKELLGVE